MIAIGSRAAYLIVAVQSRRSTPASRRPPRATQEALPLNLASQGKWAQHDHEPVQYLHLPVNPAPFIVQLCATNDIVVIIFSDKRTGGGQIICQEPQGRPELMLYSIC